MRPQPARILVVDGYAGCRSGVAAVLSEFGDQVTCCSTGLQALELAASGAPFDLLIANSALPDIDGAELVRRFRQDHPQTRVLRMTSGPEDGPLRKPFSVGQLEDAVRAVFEE